MDTYFRTGSANQRGPPRISRSACPAPRETTTHPRWPPEVCRELLSTSRQKEVSMTTLTLDAVLSKSSIPATDHPLASGIVAGPALSTVLIILAIIVMIIVLRLSRSVLTPFKEIVKASLAALGAVLLTGLVIVALILALALSA